MATATNENIGIFLDSRGVTIVRARMLGGRTEITKRGTAELPAGAVEGAVIRDPLGVAHAIRSLLRDMNLRPKSASVALGSHGYSLRSVRLPEAPASERRALVRNELEEVGAMPHRSGTFGFLWIPVPSEPGKRLVDAITYYASDSEVDQIREALRLAGLRLDRLEPASVAMVRAYLATRTGHGPIAILCTAQKHSDLCIHDGAAVRSVRRIPIGWDDLLPSLRPASPFYASNGKGDDRDLIGQSGDTAVGVFRHPRRTLNTDFGGAEAESRWPSGTADVAVATDSLDNSTPGVTRSAEAVANADFLGSELSRSIAFFAREHPNTPKPKSLVMLAPAYLVQPLAQILESATSLSIETDDPLAALDMARPLPGQAEENMDGYLPAIGAALDGAEATIPAVDLSRQDQRMQAGRRAPGMLLAGMAGSTLWMLVAAIASIALTVLEYNQRAESTRITTEITRIRAEREPLLKLAAINAAAKALEAKSVVPAASVLGRVAAATPRGIEVTSIRIGTDGKVAVEGDALSTLTMQQFALNMGQSAAIRFPGYEMMKQDERGGLSFRIAGVTRAAAAPGASPVNP